MEANELRIGNWIDYNGKHAYITAVGKKSVIIELGTVINDHSAYTESKNPNLDEINGIPLTEEWLLKFGFIKVLDYPCFRLDGLQIEFNGFDSQWGSGLLDEKTVTKYVHQLQNLFFALKGKELTLK